MEARTPPYTDEQILAQLFNQPETQDWYKPVLAAMEMSRQQFASQTPAGEAAGAAEHEKLFNFFLWFRENGETYINHSIESMIEIYLASPTPADPAAPVQPDTFVWVRCNDVMPELYPVNNTENLHFRLDGVKVDGFFLHSRCFEYFNKVMEGYSQIEHDEFGRIEWLSPTP